MSDFLNYIHKEEQKKMSEEEKLRLHKKQKQLKEQQFSVDELEDDFYDDDDFELNEAHRVQRPLSRQVQQRKVQYNQEPVDVPIQQYNDQYEEPYNEPPVLPAVSTRRKRSSQVQDMNESNAVQMNPVLREAYDLIDEMKNKMETMFFKYGMTGLERLNECMLDVCDEIMNPPVKPKFIPLENEEPIVEKTLPPKKKPATRTIKTVKKPTVNKPKTVKPIIEETEIKTPINFNDVLENADLTEIGNTLVKQSEVQENIGAKQKAQIEARAKLMEEQIAKNTKNKQHENTITEEEIAEEFEIVNDDDSTLEIDDLETTELDNPAEENEEK